MIAPMPTNEIPSLLANIGSSGITIPKPSRSMNTVIKRISRAEAGGCVAWGTCLVASRLGIDVDDRARVEENPTHRGQSSGAPAKGDNIIYGTFRSSGTKTQNGRRGTSRLDGEVGLVARGRLWRWAA